MRSLGMRLLCFSLVFFFFVNSLVGLANEKNGLVQTYESEAIQMADQIWRYAELGYLEQKSSKLLQEFLLKQNFDVRTGVDGIDTAFVATAGSGSPTIAILAEFDALPGLSQKAVPYREPVESGGSGHACGHHLFGAASVAAGARLADWIHESGVSGTVKVIGTPAEEGGSGKVYLARAGVFNDVDLVLHWHPSDANSASPYSTTANKSGRFTFKGKAAHAASAPHRGRSALDGVEAMNYLVNLMREHIPQESRIHYVITRGGDAPNIVPELAQVYYYVRHPNKAKVIELFERVVNAAKAAAMGTETSVEFEVMHGNFSVLPNYTISKVVDKNLRALGGIKYGPEEQRFAKAIAGSFIDGSRLVGSQEAIQPYRFRQSMGSTDVGDVSWLVPTAGFTTATWVPGTPGHSWQAVAAGGMSIGHKGMLLAKELLFVTGKELFLNEELIDRAKEELHQARGPDFNYQPLLGDRRPPLDYRK